MLIVLRSSSRSQSSGGPASQSERSQLTRLLCGEGGLVTVLEKAFLVGAKRTFFRQFYPWDYIEKVSEPFSLARSLRSRFSNEQDHRSRN